MPVTDGLTATRAIRAIEREGGAAAPIIAMTANAHAQDVEMSLKAGCNAHASKPISKQKLLGLIGEYARHGRPTSIQAAESRGPILIQMPPGLEEIVPAYLAIRRGDDRTSCGFRFRKARHDGAQLQGDWCVLPVAGPHQPR